MGIPFGSRNIFYNFSYIMTAFLVIALVACEDTGLVSVGRLWLDLPPPFGMSCDVDDCYCMKIGRYN